MNRGSLRSAAKQLIFGQLDGIVEGVQINYAEPKTPERERVNLGAITSASPVFLAFRSGARMPMMDVFSLELIVITEVPGVKDPQEADLRCEVICDAVLDLFADPKLGGSLDGLMAAKAGVVDGPDAYASGTGEGYGSSARLTVECQTVYN